MNCILCCMATVPHWALFYFIEIEWEEENFLKFKWSESNKELEDLSFFLKHVKLSVKYVKSEEPIVKTGHCTVSSSWGWSAQLWVWGDLHPDVTDTVQERNQEARSYMEMGSLCSACTPVHLLTCWNILWSWLEMAVSFLSTAFISFSNVQRDLAVTSWVTSVAVGVGSSP